MKKKENDEMLDNFITEHLNNMFMLDKNSEEYSKKVEELKTLYDMSNQSKRNENEMLKVKEDKASAEKKLKFDKIMGIGGILVTLTGYGIYISNWVMAHNREMNDVIITSQDAPNKNDSKSLLLKRF